MKIIADSNISLLEETFGNHGQITRVDGRHISRSDLHGASALLVRSVSQVDRRLLEGTGIRFVGTATIGTDHLDTGWLDESGIHWASAPGCNADAAAQYSLAMMWLACDRLNRKLLDQTVGIIGCGNVGSRLRMLLNTLGVQNVTCDPPLSDAGQQGLVNIETALKQELISLHVPLTKSGPYPTYQMLDADLLSSLKDGTILNNTSRAKVVNYNALRKELKNKRIHAALDVWPDEPLIDPELLKTVTLATPHVAGYSIEGKQNGTLMIYRAFCRHFGLADQSVPSNVSSQPVLNLRDIPDPIRHLLQRCCDVVADDTAMRQLIPLSREQRAQKFDQLRKNYRLRRDFKAWRVSGASDQVRQLTKQLGFQ